MAEARWTGLEEIRAALQKRLHSGSVYRDAALSSGWSTFPLRLSLVRPTREDFLQDSLAVTRWVQRLASDSARLGFRIEYKRQSMGTIVGSQELPWFVHVDSPDLALAVLGRSAQMDVQLFRRALEAAAAYGPWARCVALQAPRDVLAAIDTWPGLLAAADWLIANPRSGVHPRAIPAAGVHTKLVERNERLVGRLLRAGMPAELVDEGAKTFAGRFGLAESRRQVTFVAPGAFAGLHHLHTAEVTWPIQGLAGIDATALGICEVVVVENRAVLDVVPSRPDRLVIWGMGYSAPDLLSPVRWLKDKRVFYWGDLDTHGFAILDGVREVIPHVQSVLMDAGILSDMQQQATIEPAPREDPLRNLTPAEQQAFERLQTLTANRVEQEHIPHALVHDAFACVWPVP